MPVAFLYNQGNQCIAMPRVQLDIDDPTNHLTLKTILEADGHEVVRERPELVVADASSKAVRYAESVPTLVLARAGEIRDAVGAMRRGVFGYLFVPFQPGEAGIMMQRALASHGPNVQAEAAPPLMTIAESEARLIRATLRQCKNNQTEAARILGIGRNTLWRKLKKLKQER